MNGISAAILSAVFVLGCAAWGRQESPASGRSEDESAPSTTIVVPAKHQTDAGLKLAVEALREAMQQPTFVYLEPDADLPAGPLVFAGRPGQVAPHEGSPLKPEAFRIRSAALAGRKATVIEGDARGRMYGVFKLAERIRLGDDPFAMDIESAPAFPLRMFSEEGQLLDLPDRNYYSEAAPYVDEPRLRKEVDEAKLLVEHVARLGYNTVTFLHVNCEDYIDYKYLDQAIYAEDDRHLVRSPIFCRYLSELCDYAHARHIDVFLQLYETQYPPAVDRLYGIDLDSPNVQKIISAKCRELFQRVPLDGLVITPTESHPRCGYRSKHLWAREGRPGAGKMLTLYHNACSAVGKKAVFRLWRIAGNTSAAREACRHIPGEAMLSVKNTGGDFWLNSPLTDIVTEGFGHEQPLMVVFDTFRQYDGWSRCFCFVQQWGERVRLCKDNGVQAINAWGAWSPGCIWPDYEPGYMKGPHGSNQSGSPVPWAGYWNDFRMFTRGFTPGQANAYLLARLCWDTSVDPKQVARDFAALHLGIDNAEAGAEALMHTQQAWREHYPGDKPGAIAHPVYMKWTMVFGPREELMQEAYERLSMDQMLASNARAIDAIGKMEATFARTDRSKAPDPLIYGRFAQGIDKTALTIRSLHLFREFWWRDRADSDLDGEAKVTNAREREDVRSQLLELCEQWRKYPEEAAMWRMTHRFGEPDVYRDRAFPYWWPRGADSTMEAMLDAKPGGQDPRINKVKSMQMKTKSVIKTGTVLSATIMLMGTVASSQTQERQGKFAQDKQSDLRRDWGPFAGPWVRHDKNPVIRLEGEETYSIQNGPQSVIQWQDKWYMFLMTSQPMVTKLAVSDDGLTWTRPHHNYLLKPEMPWEGSYTLAKAAVVRDEEVWLYYFGKKDKTEMVGLARSGDLTKWRKEPRPILTHQDSRIDGERAFPDCIIKEGDTWYMYYDVGWDYEDSRNPDGYRIGVASSEDGISWTDSPKSPVLTTSNQTTDSWDDGMVSQCSVTKIGDWFYMLYSGSTNNYGRKHSGKNRMAFGLARARQPEGPWQKYPYNPVFKPTGYENDFDGVFLQHPCPINIDGQWLLYYNGWTLNPAAKNSIGAEYAIGVAFTRELFEEQKNRQTEGQFK